MNLEVAFCLIITAIIQVNYSRNVQYQQAACSKSYSPAPSARESFCSQTVEPAGMKQVAIVLLLSLGEFDCAPNATCAV